MSWTTAIAIYFMIWWVVLFAVLPWGVRTQEESDGGGHRPRRAGHAEHAGEAHLDHWSQASYSRFVRCLVYRLVSLDDLATLWGLLKA